MKLPLLVATIVAAALAVPTGASAEVTWLCHPGVSPNPCNESQATTVQSADGTSRVVTPKNASKPKADCFYVYPTVSNQTTVNATKAKDPEVLAIARYQAARYAVTCRVIAPVYRQLTVSSIYTSSVEERAAGRKIAYGDVREAFLRYLRRDNRGRPVVFVGHSQGTGMLRQLLRQEVDPKPEVRRLMAGAVLMGGNVAVPKGRKVGGDFQHLPGCTRRGQAGCVIAFSTFDEQPPDNTRFGKVPATDTTGAGLPAGDRYEVLCTNPASLAANRTSTFAPLLRSEPFPPGLIFTGLLVLYGGPPPTAPTPWLSPKDRYTGRCETSNGANVLMVHPTAGSQDLKASPTPDWGLHLADANLPLPALVADVKAQIRAWVKARR